LYYAQRGIATLGTTWDNSWVLSAILQTFTFC
jgi:hypothetical protein